MYHYLNAEQEADANTLPSIETFYHTPVIGETPDDDEPEAEGWYFWFCLPGCLPDSEAEGPFESEQQAIEAARDEGNW